MTALARPCYGPSRSTNPLAHSADIPTTQRGLQTGASFTLCTGRFSLPVSLAMSLSPHESEVIFSGQGEIPYRWSQPTSGLCFCKGVSRPGAIPGPTVIVRMEENGEPRTAPIRRRHRVCSSALGHMRTEERTTRRWLKRSPPRSRRLASWSSLDRGLYSECGIGCQDALCLRGRRR